MLDFMSVLGKGLLPYWFMKIVRVHWILIKEIQVSNLTSVHLLVEAPACIISEGPSVLMAHLNLHILISAPEIDNMN